MLDRLSVTSEAPDLASGQSVFPLRPVLRLDGPSAKAQAALAQDLISMRDLVLAAPSTLTKGSSVADFQVKSWHADGRLFALGTHVAHALTDDFLPAAHMKAWSFFATNLVALAQNPFMANPTAQPYTILLEPRLSGATRINETFLTWVPEGSPVGTDVYVPRRRGPRREEDKSYVEALSVPCYMIDSATREDFSALCREGLIHAQTLEAGPRWLFYPSVIHNREPLPFLEDPRGWTYSFRVMLERF